MLQIKAQSFINNPHKATGLVKLNNESKSVSIQGQDGG